MPRLPAKARLARPEAAVTARVESGVGRHGRRAWVPSPALQGVIALAIYAAAFVALGGLILVQHASTPMINQGTPDANFFVWSLAWWRYSIAHGINPLHTTLLGAPTGYNLAWATLAPTLGVLAVPLTATAGPVAAFNLLLAAAMPTAAWATFVLCRRLTGRFWPALIAGGIYGFSAFETSHVGGGQLDLAFSMLLPLMAYLVVLWKDAAIGSPTFVGLLALAILAQAYLFLETFAEMTAIWAVALVVGYTLAGRSGRPVVARLSALVGAAYVVALVFVGPYILYMLAHPTPVYSRSYLSLDLSTLVVVPAVAHTPGLGWLAQAGWVVGGGSDAGYLGVPALAVTIALAVRPWSTRLSRFLLVTLLLIILAALGPVLFVAGRKVLTFPWHSLWDLPLARSAWPERIMLFGFLAVAVAVALWLCHPRNPAWLRLLTAVLVVVAMIESVPKLQLSSQQTASPAFITAGDYRHCLTRGETVLVLSDRANANMLWQAEMDFYVRVAGGFISSAIRDATFGYIALLRHPTDQGANFLRYLRRDKIGAILIEDGWVPFWRSWPTWPQALARLHFTGETIGGVMVYPVGTPLRDCSGPPPANIRRI